MKRTYRMFFVMTAVLAIFVAGPFSAMATSMDSEEITEVTTEHVSLEHESEETSPSTRQTATEPNESEEVETVEEADGYTEATLTTESVIEPPLEENETTDDIANAHTTQEEATTDTNQTTGVIEDETLPEEDALEEEKQVRMEEKEKADELEQLLSEQEKQAGLYYYLQKYQYDCMQFYMKKYIAYIDMQIKAYEQMYEMGKTTETILKSYQAQKATAEAELKVAMNESNYNQFYLEKNELDYSEYDIKTVKGVESIDYYVGAYPEKDDMTFARYVTDYNNAVAGIEAKKVEISALETEITMWTLLWEAGEISQLELEEKKISLAQAEYELEQYYVEMNVAYNNLDLMCK